MSKQTPPKKPDKKPDKALDELRKRIRPFPVPPAGFDPRMADAARLSQYGLPPKPDRHTQPVEFAYWWKLFSPPLKFMAASFSFAGPDFLVIPHGSPAASPRYESSENWSGAFITPNHDTMFTALHGSWQIPTPSPPKFGANGVPVDGDYRSSTWIGLDGQRKYLNSSLPQIGTAQFVKVVNGQATTTIQAWWQWWVRGQLNPPVVLPLPVKAGDLVSCNMTVIDPNRVRFSMKNHTTGHFIVPFDVAAGSVQVGNPPAQVQLRVSGATAEWIVERPTDINPPHALYELADYGTVVFSDCFALAAPAPGKPGRAQELPGAKLINMFAVREGPHRIETISSARREGDQEAATFFR